MHPLETYLQDLAQIHATGANVKELSFYPALANLLNEIGAGLKPKVRAVISLRNQGAGMPDGGLFTAGQFGRGADAEALDGQTPERGALEVKGPQADARAIAESQQVRDYLSRYGLVLVTTLREFLLVSRDAAGHPQILESYMLAPDKDAFWQLVRRPRAAANEHGARLAEFLKRALLTAAPLGDPQDVAWFLASYARDARACVDRAGDLPALNALRQAMQESLRMDFSGPKGEHFFRSTLVQTLFYGVFSAWVLWNHESPAPGERFDWRLSAHILKTPVIQALFYQLSDPNKLKALGLTEYLALTGAALNRVDRPAFFARFEASQAVQYFYEPFLEAYDPDLRKELGVWYTPPEIVQYMVERVDRVLRAELGLRDGLADPNVYVLDPCCGTGAYPLEVLKRIARTLREKGEEALLGYELKRAATQRVCGFELLPAPFVISHLQIGLLLQQHGAPLNDDERAAVYLTNALTGWDAPAGAQQAWLLPELAAERDAAERIKRETPVLVVLGNPPYNAFAGVGATDEEQALVEPYKAGLVEKWGIKKFNLDDLYVRFFRLAERRIAEQTGRGVVCFISNHSWTKEPSFVVLRQHLLESFDKFWVENMHGDRKISEYAPDGHTSETIFAVPGFSVGIRQGTAITLWMKSGHRSDPRVLFRDDLTEAKAQKRREHLLATLQESNFDAAYQPAAPAEQNRFSFRPVDVAAHYLEWPKVIELSKVYPFNGPIERRGNSLIVFDHQRAHLETALSNYLDSQKSDEEIKAIEPRFMLSSGEFKAKEARSRLKQKARFDSRKIVCYPFKPFDMRLAYLADDIQPLFSRPSPELLKLTEIPGNTFFITRDTADKDPEGVPFYFSRFVSDYDCISGHARHFPMRIAPQKSRQAPKEQEMLFNTESLPIANLSDRARAYLGGLGVADPDGDAALKVEGLADGLKPYELLWLHALAIGYAPAYLRENRDGVRGDWPRIPLPASCAALLRSVALGRQVAQLLSDAEAPAATEAFKSVAVLRRTDGAQINPQAGDLALEAGWGHAQGNVVMPGQGKLVQYPEEAASGLPNPSGLTYDVYLNERVYWRNVPAPVWEYVIGGYQVLKKWLSYREKKILGRDVTVDEARAGAAIARRIAALLALEPALDENYRAVKDATAVW